MLCERGIRTFETAYRFTLDLTAIPVLKEMTHLPIVVDPSHAAGRRALVEPLSLAAAAVGADGIIVETHPEPDEAICDGPQQLRVDQFNAYARKVEQAAELAGKLPFGAAATQARRGVTERRRRAVVWPGGSLRAAAASGVVGLGLIGGSVGLAARERPSAHVVGFDPDPRGAGARRWSGARSTSRSTTRAARRGRRRRWSPRRSARWRRRSATACDALSPARSSPTSARPSARSSPRNARDPLHRRAPAGGRGGRGRRARARRPVRRRHLVPDAARRLRGHPAGAPAPLRRRPRRGADDHRRRRPRPPDGRRSPTCRTSSPTCSSRRPRAALGDEAIPVVGPSFRDATRVAGANPRAVGRDLRRQPRRGPRRARRDDRAARPRRARCSPRDDTAAIEAWQAAGRNDSAARCSTSA